MIYFAIMATIASIGSIVLGSVKNQEEILMEDGFLHKFFIELSNQNQNKGLVETQRQDDLSVIQEERDSDVERFRSTQSRALGSETSQNRFGSQPRDMTTYSITVNRQLQKREKRFLILIYDDSMKLLIPLIIYAGLLLSSLDPISSRFWRSISQN